jgi:hypothetical protein
VPASVSISIVRSFASDANGIPNASSPTSTYTTRSFGGKRPSSLLRTAKSGDESTLS